MLKVLGVLAFVVALLMSVMIHEFGHFLTAKRFGMKVTEFFLGFGTKLWSFQRGETEFGIKAIPAGGYCRIVGMSTHEQLSTEDEPRAFIRASTPRRLIVLGAGSCTHFLLGFLLIFIIFIGIGVQAIQPVIEQVLPCLTTSSKPCASSAPLSPALSAGLKPGDRILSVNGEKVVDWSKDILIIRASAGKPVALVLQRGSEKLAITVIPATEVIDRKTIGMLGIMSKVGLQRESFITATKDTGALSWNLFSTSITSLISIPTKVPALFRQTFMGAKRDPYGLVGVVGVAQASAATAGNSYMSTGKKVETFLLIIASLNIFVGIFNLLPLLPLDGGHMAVALVDGFRRSRARRRGLPEPSLVDLQVLTPITIVVFVLLAGLSLMLLAADIFNPVHFNL